MVIVNEVLPSGLLVRFSVSVPLTEPLAANHVNCTLSVVPTAFTCLTIAPAPNGGPAIVPVAVYLPTGSPCRVWNTAVSLRRCALAAMPPP